MAHGRFRTALVAGCLTVAPMALAPSLSLAAPAAPPLGAAYPGAQVRPEDSSNAPCGHRYHLSVHASLDQVVSFYEREGRTAGLQEIVSHDPPVAHFRNFAFVAPKGQPHRLLFVILGEAAGVTTGGVTYDTLSGPACR